MTHVTKSLVSCEALFPGAVSRQTAPSGQRREHEQPGDAVPTVPGTQRVSLSSATYSYYLRSTEHAGAYQGLHQSSFYPTIFEHAVAPQRPTRLQFSSITG